ncbi:hypothetical protein A9C19_20710 (plasmid) [Bacillus weihaiensis]|uniref:Restriction endonuclease type II-like domain-containing protein n=1 Tax=Bacillus weihaiensis TaxID=1547283 RepID=A0A1L3MY47_9BACI|nr:DUF559 domain-containing protein [Bacillus weihaiensis]APH07220.1 hypothetical protein A9C19_20710 [Bacillus weihaiensis]
MLELIGLVVFVLIFVIMPIFYTVDHIRNPEFADVSKVDIQRLKCESPIENRLYSALTTRGYYVATQVPCGKYRIDLALPHHNLAIECDGKKYHSTPAQKAHDRRKNIYLRKNGWKVLRFSGKQINGNMKRVLKIIEDTINTD